MKKSSKILLVLTVFAGLTLSEETLAYIPPAPFLIKNMSSKRSGLKTLKITTTVSGYDAGKPSGTHFKTIMFYSAINQDWKSAAFDDAGNELFAIEKKAQEIPLSWSVLFESAPREISKNLERAEIPVFETREEKQAERPSSKKSPEPLPSGTIKLSHSAADDPIPDNTFLKRWNGAAAWVIGKPTSSQFWIEKDSFLPVRLIVKDQDIQYSHYRYSQDLPFPRVISMSAAGSGGKPGEMQFEETLNDSSVNSKDNEKILNMGSVAKDATAEGFFTDAGNSASSSVKDLIKKYYYGGVR
jgi:hypothetical protein